jgi:hypothetical protein
MFKPIGKLKIKAYKNVISNDEHKLVLLPIMNGVYWALNGRRNREHKKKNNTKARALWLEPRTFFSWYSVTILKQKTDKFHIYTYYFYSITELGTPFLYLFKKKKRKDNKADNVINNQKLESID